MRFRKASAEQDQDIEEPNELAEITPENIRLHKRYLAEKEYKAIIEPCVYALISVYHKGTSACQFDPDVWPLETVMESTCISRNTTL